MANASMFRQFPMRTAAICCAARWWRTPINAPADVYEPSERLFPASVCEPKLSEGHANAPRTAKWNISLGTARPILSEVLWGE